MIKTVVLCDMCERPIPEERVEGVEHTANVQLHVTKEWDTRRLFPHLCEKCATKIDSALAAMKNRVTTKQLICERNRRINEERRKRLGTKG